MSPGQRKLNLAAAYRRRGRGVQEVTANAVCHVVHQVGVLDHQVRVARDLAGETWGMVANHGHELRQLRRYVHVGDFALRLVLGVAISALVIVALRHLGVR